MSTQASGNTDSSQTDQPVARGQEGEEEEEEEEAAEDNAGAKTNDELELQLPLTTPGLQHPSPVVRLSDDSHQSPQSPSQLRKEKNYRVSEPIRFPPPPVLFVHQIPPPPPSAQIRCPVVL